MSPEAQRIAIATACGAFHHRWEKPEGEIAIGGEVDLQCADCCQFQSEDPSNHCVLADCPDYLNDLNAMHEAEKVLTIHNFAAYEIELCDVIQSTGTDPDIWHYVLTSTAAQRAEAFLRAKGLWQDERPSHREVP